MKALKALVIFLGVLIVAGVGLVIYGVSSKVGPKSTPPVTTGATTALSSTNFGSVDVALPKGATIEQVFAAGNHIIVRIGTDKGIADRLIVLDPARGQVTGSFVFVATPETSATQ
ncbi:hypothetical protein [Magnetospirillum molischianum]|uniref:Uncharacterized protein n=1 Tax=Magnetospirillum molischianum DSM 120 TaxID=1150626 RepID=H8FQP3_MAGML|nr:hypothetical protein [Magnetospirillum molischianum]CCG40681.1 conserved exported hypothetical protein [Magnetospirillum molischianum DSM 120]